ncbi:MAG: hypothetical protein AB1630_05755 [bacterium]
MKSYIFYYRKEKTKEGEIIYRPVAYVHLKGKDGKGISLTPILIQVQTSVCSQDQTAIY